jgi:exonuclease SbcC
MEILSVSLTNFKSHRDRQVAFQPGTNAICGENGAGKTSILEAIAWVLFDYRGRYKLEDLIRNGCTSAQVQIAFVSNADQRTYEIHRCTRAGYTIYDPQVGQKLDYKRIDEEVMPWLRQQLGVAPGTNLAELFANTIGVPQGMFTADFLKADRERKDTFDRILKVDEYRKAYDKLASLNKYAEAIVDALKQDIARYDEALTKQTPLQQQRDALQAEIQQAELTQRQLEGELAILKTEKAGLATQAQQVQQLEAQVQQLRGQLAGKQQAQIVLAQATDRARAAVSLQAANRSDYEQFQQAESALKQFEVRARQQRQCQQQREQQQQALFAGETELTRLTVQLEGLHQAQQELDQLQPFVQQQETLERQLADATQQLQRLQSCETEKGNLEQYLTRLRHDWRQVTKEIERLRGLEASIAEIPQLEQQRDRVQSQLSRIEAARQFEAELRQLVVQAETKREQVQATTELALEQLQRVQFQSPEPTGELIAAAMSAIASGMELQADLLTALRQILGDLADQVSAPALMQQLQQLRHDLDRAYQQRAEVGTLTVKQSQQAQIQSAGEQTQVQINQLVEQLETESNWQARQSELVSHLERLENPRGRAQLLQRDLRQQAKLQAQHQQRSQARSDLKAALKDLDDQLAEFADLEIQIDAQRQRCEVTKVGYLTYLKHQNDAEQLPDLESKLEATNIEIQQLLTAQAEVQADYEAAIADYSPERLQQLEAAYSERFAQMERLRGGLPQQQQRLADFDRQLAELAAIALKRQQSESDLKQKDKVRKFIKFARDAYKKAAPRITERYVQTVSQEADKLFRELLNRANVGLEWTKDYEILVQEGAHTRRFINLSGGEQMCAALAVRLALLKVLADIDIAFFDEPTTNMDRLRRVQLADAIANIKTFRQLFVISHDDTFEQITENIILVEREG